MQFFIFLNYSLKLLHFLFADFILHEYSAEGYFTRRLEKCSWGCLHVHRETHLFLSVSVDDFRTWLVKGKLGSGVEKIKKHTELDDPTHYLVQVRLGCTHPAAANDEPSIKVNSEQVRRITTSHVDTEHENRKATYFHAVAS